MYLMDDKEMLLQNKVFVVNSNITSTALGSL